MLTSFYSTLTETVLSVCAPNSHVNKFCPQTGMHMRQLNLLTKVMCLCRQTKYNKVNTLLSCAPAAGEAPVPQTWREQGKKTIAELSYIQQYAVTLGYIEG